MKVNADILFSAICFLIAVILIVGVLQLKVIFLDVDGPIIPVSLYSLDKGCSATRGIMSTTAIGFVQRMCDMYQYKLVMNSSHNYMDLPNSLRDDLIRFKFNPDHFHHYWRTKYPYTKKTTEDFLTPRMRSIVEWISTYGPIENWVCFDDENFTSLPNLVLIDFNDGITYEKYLKAIEIMEGTINVKDKFWS